jgi:hypothetical protein
VLKSLFEEHNKVCMYVCMYGQQYTQITKTNMDATICLENIRIKITCWNKRAPDIPVQVSKSDSLRESFCLSAE